jgi:hypothetical protein
MASNVLHLALNVICNTHKRNRHTVIQLLPKTLCIFICGPLNSFYIWQQDMGTERTFVIENVYFMWLSKPTFCSDGIADCIPCSNWCLLRGKQHFSQMYNRRNVEPRSYLSMMKFFFIISPNTYRSDIFLVTELRGGGGLKRNSVSDKWHFWYVDAVAHTRPILSIVFIWRVKFETRKNTLLNLW